MSTTDDLAQLEEAIARLEAQRSVLGDATVDLVLGPLRQRLSELRQAAPAPPLRAERKLVTVMFADVSGFTALAETMDPEAVRDLMNACFEQLVPIIEKYGGTVDKFIGDEIMALFGAPVTHENDPERALRAALEMMDGLAEFNTDQGTDLGLHFGINTGLVIAGGIGTRQRQEYSVMGHPVNLATRLEDVSERGEILVGPGTYRLTAPLFEFEELQPVRVKGKAEPVPVYRLLAPRVVPRRTRGIVGLASPLVGREAEFRTLQEVVERLRTGEGNVVTIVGEAGLGKSRLMAELREQVQGQAPPLSRQWIEGRCLSYGTSIAYWLWLDVLRGLLGLSPEDSPVAVRERLRERVQTLCPERYEDVYPYLGWLMSLPLEAEAEATVSQLEGESLKRHTFRAVEMLIEYAASQGPLVLVCEDLHWADPTSIELLEKLLALSVRTRLLLICAFRPYKEHGCWRIKETAAQLYPDCHIDLHLTPLSSAQSEALVGNLLRLEEPPPALSKGLPQQLKQRILSHAEGNPFYVEEIIRSLIDSEAIVWDEGAGHWRATGDVHDIAIPDTLHGVLMARIDRLRDDTKRVLQMAAVIGRIFLYRVLAAIAESTTAVQEKRELDTHLLTLQQEEMIRERARMPELEYIFKHHLTQEAAYNGLLRKERRAFHRQVAEALERLFPERVEEQVGLLAYHWERAEEPEKATEYLLRAGDQARLAYAHGEAIDTYQRALVFLKEQGHHEQAARTLMKLGLTYHLAFDFQRARQAYEEGFALWQRAGEVKPGVPPPPAPHALRVNWNQPTTLDPTMADDVYSRAVIESLFSGLMEQTPEMGVLPDVARTWEVSEGGRKYVFHLRDDVRWSDGEPVTAEDFEYAWKRVLDPATGSPNASLLYDVKGARAFHQGDLSDPDQVGVRALDALTLVVELDRPTGYFPHVLASLASYPVPRHRVEAHGDDWTKLAVTNGPFRLEAWNRDESMVLVRNPEYHGRSTGNLQKVIVSLLSDPSARLGVYEADGLDVLPLWGLPALEMDRARRRYAGEYVLVPWLVTWYIGFDVSRRPFDDRRVRRAFVLATDREALADVALGGFHFPAMGGFVPPTMPGHSPEIGLRYDPHRARQLLSEAGYPGGHGFPGFEALTSQGASWTTMSEHLQGQWRENLGLEVTWGRMPYGPFMDRVEKDTPNVFFFGWGADYPDPDSFLRLSPLQYHTRWRNDAYERLVEEARGVMDQGERMRMYKQADRILIEEAAIIPLAYVRWHLLVKPWVRKFPTSPIRRWFWKDVIIEPH